MNMIWIQICAVLVIWLSFWSLIPRDEWWFRGADFPRLQILALGLFSFFAMLFAIPKWTLTTELLFVGLVAAIAYQLKMVLPYTPIWKKQVQKVKPEQINENQQIGGRIAGSPQMYKAEAWGEKALKEMGADKVWLQECMVPRWVRGAKEDARVVTIDGKKANRDDAQAQRSIYRMMSKERNHRNYRNRHMERVGKICGIWI
jgi:hypothetical protein